MTSLSIWKEEYEAIERDIDERGACRETARRFLVFTEGFLYYIVYGLVNPTEEDIQSAEALLKSIKFNKKKHIGFYNNRKKEV